MSRSFLLGLDERLSVAHVLAALDRQPVDERYWCPFHDDERPDGSPSAEVWCREDGEVLRCWSCGKIATPTELLAKFNATHLGPKLLKTTPEVKPASTREYFSPEELEEELERTTAGVRYPRGDPVEEFTRSRAAQDLRSPPVSWLKSEWGWRGTYRGWLAVPHRDLPGYLTGIKYRVPPEWDKLSYRRSRKHSRFSQLYGGWRLRRWGIQPPEEVWLCEGETDTVWAAFSLREVAAAVGLPGVSLRVQAEDLELFRGRTAVIALDSDAAGKEARRRWQSELAPVARRVIHLHLDPGEDLCQTSETPIQLRTWA